MFYRRGNNVSGTSCAETSDFFSTSDREFSQVSQEEAKRSSVARKASHRIVSQRQAILALRLLLGSRRPSSRYPASFLSVSFATGLLVSGFSRLTDKRNPAFSPFLREILHSDIKPMMETGARFSEKFHRSISSLG